jgi:hypothetical protein
MGMISLPGHTVGDLFAGSGMFAKTCMMNRRNVVVVELDIDMFAHTKDAVTVKLSNAATDLESKIVMPLSVMPLDAGQLASHCAGTLERKNGKYFPLPFLFDHVQPSPSSVTMEAFGRSSEFVQHLFDGAVNAWKKFKPVRVSYEPRRFSFLGTGSIF